MSEINREAGDKPLYAIVLETQMQERGLTLEQAYNAFIDELEQGHDSGVEHLAEAKSAYEFLKSQNGH